MTYKTADEVFEERNERIRKESKDKFIKEFNKSLEPIIRKIKIFKFLFKVFGFLFLTILILGSIWLIKLLIVSLFF